MVLRYCGSTMTAENVVKNMLLMYNILLCVARVIDTTCLSENVRTI